MDISRNQKEAVEKIIAGNKCPKDFKCYKAGFENLCKVRWIVTEGYVDCLEKDPKDCSFAKPYEDGYFCSCPIRNYIVKELKK